MITEQNLRQRLASAADGIDASPDLGRLLERRIEERATSSRRRNAATLSAIVVTMAIAASMTWNGEQEVPLTTATPRSSQSGWIPIAESPIESRFQHTQVVIDGRMLVFGGYTKESSEAKGSAVYDPERGTWTETGDPPGSMKSATGVSAGDRMYAIDTNGMLLSFELATARWSALGQSPFRTAANTMTAMVWTGERLLVVNSASGSRGSASYDPGEDRWTEIAPPPVDFAFFDAVWTGEEMIVVADFGGSGISYPSLVLFALDPDTGWRPLPSPPLADVERRTHGFAVWTGSELIVGGGTTLPSDADDVSDRLRRENREPTQSERTVLQPRPARDVAAWSPASSSWRTLPDAPVDITGIDLYPDVWTGSVVIAWKDGGRAGGDAGGVPVLLDPTNGRWRVAPAPPAGEHQEAPAVWTGSELIIWSGETGGDDRNTMECCTPSPAGYAIRL